MNVKLLTEHHLEFLSIKGGCTGSSESTHVKIPHCWKSHVTVHIFSFRSGLFTPDMAFEAIVKIQIEKLRAPSLKCCDMVVNELTNVIKKCSEKVSGSE